MPIAKKLRRSRAPFNDGVELSGPAGLEALSVSCAMSSQSPESFRAAVLAPTFGETMVTRTFAHHLRATRTKAMVDDMYADFVQIAFVLAGSTRSQQLDDRRITKAGEATALFTGAPFDSQFNPAADVLQFHLPLSLLHEHRFSPTELAKHRWTATPIALAMQRFLSTITATPGAVTASAAPSVGRAITEMGLASCTSSEVNSCRPRTREKPSGSGHWTTLHSTSAIQISMSTAWRLTSAPAAATSKDCSRSKARELAARSAKLDWATQHNC